MAMTRANGNKSLNGSPVRACLPSEMRARRASATNVIASSPMSPLTRTDGMHRYIATPAPCRIGSARGLMLPGTPIPASANALIESDDVPTGEIAQRTEIANFTGDSGTSRSRREHGRAS